MTLLKNSFEVVDILPVDTNSCRVIGRAYDDIRVGDVLFMEDTTPDHEMEERQFEVTAIYFHSVWVTEINRGDTAHLTLAGEVIEKLKYGTVLGKPTL